MNIPTRIIVLHGSFGSPDGNWFPWLKKNFESEGVQVIVPRFPSPNGQSLVAWTEVFNQEIGALDQSSILIGHSLGAGFALSLLESSTSPIEATFLVAGFLGELGLPDYDKINASFVCKEFDWQKIKKNAGELVIVSGDNDPYVPFVKGEQLASHLQSPLTVIPGGGHLNAESGFDSFPWLEARINTLIQTKISNRN
jgi:predicted alpha/beta hydrolase family esterase